MPSYALVVRGKRLEVLFHASLMQLFDFSNENTELFILGFNTAVVCAGLSIYLRSQSLIISFFSFEVMKRVRTEQIQMAVSCYLKRRQYVDSEGPLKQGLRLCQTAEEMAANLTGNPVVFSMHASWQSSDKCEYVYWQYVNLSVCMDSSPFEIKKFPILKLM